MDEKKQFYTDLRKLMIPIAFQNFMMTLVSATDALVLARVDQNSVAAVSLATEINFIMSLFIGTVVSGIAIMAAQYLGKGDRRTVKNLMGMAVRYNFAISLLFFLVAQFAPERLMMLYTSDSALIQIGAGYLKIAGWSYLLSALSQCYLCIMKISGGAGVSAMITTLTAVVDVVVDIVLVYGLFGVRRMGANGTAISTVVVCFIELLGVLIYSHQKDRFHPSFKNLCFFSKELETDFWKLSTPVLANHLVWGVGFSMNAAIIGHMGADAAAANSIASLIRNLFTCFIRGVGNGAGIMIGKSLGNNELELAKRNGVRLVKAAVVCGICSAAAISLLGPLVSRFFILNEIARRYLNQMIPVCAVYLIAKAINVTVVSNIFPAGGDTKYDAVSTAISSWLFSLPLGFLAAFVLELPVIVVYFIVSLDEIVKVPWLYPRFKKYYWLQNLTRDFQETENT